MVYENLYKANQEGMIKSEYEIKVGRLYKKIEKLKQQRDYYKEKCIYYKKVFEESPFIETRYTSYRDRVDEMKNSKARTKELEIRIFEQEQLIKRLLEERSANAR